MSRIKNKKSILKIVKYYLKIDQNALFTSKSTAYNQAYCTLNYSYIHTSSWSTFAPTDDK